MKPRIAGNYGVDAPYVPALFALFAIASLVAGVLGKSGMWVALAVFFALQGFSYYYTTRSGKFVIWQAQLDKLNLQGDERALDVACGRGMVLIETALLLPQGQAVGIDLWRSIDQSGNDPEETMRNAEANGVADRVKLDTQDMSKLTFDDASFDLVTASTAIQNIKDRSLRKQTVEHILRVTKPGGTIIIGDIQYSKQYRDDLIELGAQNVQLTTAGWRGWFGNPFFATRFVTANRAE